MSLLDLQKSLSSLLPKDSRPVVVYTGLWTLLPGLPSAVSKPAESVLEVLQSVLGTKRTVLMPTYTNGYRNGYLDLDHEPGTTGMINELFRKQPASYRTASVFFSFAAQGPMAESLGSLRPKDVWGEGSLFEWIEAENAYLLMLGVPLQMCSFLHRFEWNAQVPYRYKKDFVGKILLRGREESLNERLYVRSLDPVAENSWPNLEEGLKSQWLVKSAFGRGSLILTDAKSLSRVVMGRLSVDPYSFVKNPDHLRHFFNGGSLHA